MSTRKPPTDARGPACAQNGTYQYRLVAWNGYGWSPDALSAPVSTLDAGLPCATGDGAAAGTPRRRGRVSAWLTGLTVAAVAVAAAALLRLGWGSQVQTCKP